MPGRLVHRSVIGALLFSLSVVNPRLQSPSLDTQLLTACQNGDLASVAALLAKGAAVNARNEFELTPLIMAADKGNSDLMRLLLSHGADVNAKDHTYGKTPLKAAITSWADLRGDLAPKARKDRADMIELLLEKGADGGDALGELITAGYVDAARRVISRNDVDPVYLKLALASAKRARQTEMTELLIKAGATDPGPEDSVRSVARLKLLAGMYRSESGRRLELVLDEEDLMLDRPGQDRVFLLPLDLTTLRSRDRKLVVTLKTAKVPPEELKLTDSGQPEVFIRISPQ
jgi:hypothetical protein